MTHGSMRGTPVSSLSLSRQLFSLVLLHTLIWTCGLECYKTFYRVSMAKSGCARGRPDRVYALVESYILFARSAGCSYCVTVLLGCSLSFYYVSFALCYDHVEFSRLFTRIYVYISLHTPLVTILVPQQVYISTEKNLDRFNSRWLCFKSCHVTRKRWN